MFYFFSRCPLAEQNSNSASSASLGAPRHRSRELSSLHRRQDSATSQISELAQPMELDDEDKAAMSSIVEEHSDEVIDPPEISVGAFTPILGLLLMEPNIEVSSWARAAVVRFLCRINEKEIPAAFQDESANVPASPTRRLQERRSSIDVDEPQIGGAAPRAHRHTTYTLTDAARKALEQQILVDVVLGLARLESADEDDSDDDGDTMSQAEERYRQSRESECEDVEFADGTRTPTAARPFAPASPPSWDMRSESPTVEQEEYVSTGPSRTLDQEDEGWASVDRNGGSPSGPSSASPDWGMPLRSFQPAPAAPTSLSSSASMSHGGNFYGMSAFDGDTEVEDEATQGKIASLELVSAIALSQCLPEQQVADAFLPEVKKMVDDPAPRVRSIAASALGPLAKALPAELVSSLLVRLAVSQYGAALIVSAGFSDGVLFQRSSSDSPPMGLLDAS